MKKTKLEQLASEKNNPCVTISMTTHRTHPDNLTDTITFKNLLKQAHERVTKEFGKHDVSDLLKKIDGLKDEFDVNYNLESLHIFISTSTKEVVKSMWPSTGNSVQIGEKFNLRPLIKAYNRTEEYLILLLSQSGVNLFHALNDGISEEIKNDDFPFSKNTHVATDSEKLSDGKGVDNLVKEFFNEVDKAVVKVHHLSGMNCVVICTEDNYSRLLKVADKPSVYEGYVPVNYNNTAHHTLGAAAWDLIKHAQNDRRTLAIREMLEAVGQGQVITDLSEIFRAAKEGRGDLLIHHDNYHQAVKMTGELTFDLIDDVTLPDAIDDITSEIAWEVFSKKGRVMYTEQNELTSLGELALKVRY